MKQHKRLIFAVCYLAYASVYIARINLSVCAPQLKELAVLDSAQLGALGSAFSIVYAAGRLINGTVSDHVGPRRMICIGLLISGLSNLSFSFFAPYPALLLFWALNAFGQSMLWSALLCVMSSVYDASTAKRADSYLVTSVASGNIAAILLATLMINAFGVKWAFIVPGFLTLVMAAACFLALARVSGGTPQAKQTSPAGKTGVLPLFLLRSRPIRCAAVPALLHGVIKDNVTLWMTVIMVDRYAVDLAQSAWFVLLVPTIGFAGRALYPFCYRLCRNQEHLLSQRAFVVCIAASVLLCIPPIGPMAAIICLGVIYAAASVINTSMVSIYPTRFAASGHLASTSGLMDFITYLGAGLGSMIYGSVADSLGYTPMFLSWAVLSVVSAIVLAKLQRSSMDT